MAGMNGRLGAQLRVTTNTGDEVEGKQFFVEIGAANIVHSVVVCQRLEKDIEDYAWTKSNIINDFAASAEPTRPPDESQPFADLRHAAALAYKLRGAGVQKPRGMAQASPSSFRRCSTP